MKFQKKIIYFPKKGIFNFFIKHRKFNNLNNINNLFFKQYIK